MANREDRTLSAPYVYVDGRRFKIIPNSCKHEIPGEAKLRAVSAGGGAISIVHGVDLEASVCKIVFETAATQEYVEAAEEYSARRLTGDQTTIKIVEDESEAHYDQCMLTAKIDVDRSAEGRLQWEFGGRYLPVS